MTKLRCAVIDGDGRDSENNRCEEGNAKGKNTRRPLAVAKALEAAHILVERKGEAAPGLGKHRLPPDRLPQCIAQSW